MSDKIPKVTVPRKLAELQEEYNKLHTKSGELHYRNFLNNLEIADTHKRMLQINQEGAQRIELDKQFAEEEAAKKEEAPEASPAPTEQPKEA